MGRLGGPVVGVTAVVLGLLPLAASVAASASGTGELRVRIDGLPAGVDGVALLRAPDGTTLRVRRTVLLRGLGPGEYRLRVLAVRITRRSSWLPEGGTAYPAVATPSVRVRPGAVAHVAILYGTIQSATARLLRTEPLQVSGDPANPTAIEVPDFPSAARGTILVATPSRVLPAGLFHVVTEVSHTGHDALVSLRPARVPEVYPSLYLNGRLPLGSEGTAAFQASGTDWAGSACGGPPPEAYSNAASLHPTLLARRFLLRAGTATGTLMAKLSGSITFDLPVDSASSCAAILPLASPWRGFLDVGGSIPVPVYVQPSVAIRWQASAPFTFKAIQSLSVTAGVQFARGHIHPLFSGRSRLTASLAHVGDVTTAGGFEARWGLGLPQATLAYLQVAPTASGEAAPCTFSAKVSFEGGLDLLRRPLSATSSYNPPGSPCPRHILTVASEGTGQGSVVGDPGIACNTLCSVNLDEGTPITLTAAPAPGSTFVGWSGGGCAGTDTCTLDLGADTTITASFTRPTLTGSADPSGPARAQLISLLQNVTQANASAYETFDGTGHTVDTIKIFPSPAGGYLGIYHVYNNGVFEVRLGTSADLVHWTYAATLDRNASQPAIAQLADGSFLIVEEKRSANGSSHLRFLDYAALAALEAAKPAATYDAPLTLSQSNEGTPNIRSAAMASGLGSSQIQIGFHYWDSSVNGDREALGTLTNFSSWSAQPNDALNSAFSSPIPANIGDRTFFSFDGYLFTLMEAQQVSGDWTTWRLFLYDETAHTLSQLNVATAGGSESFSNPAVTTVSDPAGHRALAVSYFIPWQGSARGEAGPLIFYAEY